MVTSDNRNLASHVRYFFAGMGRAIDIFSTYNNGCSNANKDGHDLDMEAIRLDWENVGRDIRRAMVSYEQST